MILHIPHSSTKMIYGVDVPNLEKNLNLLTDWYAGELFQHSTASRVVANLSRLVVDVERLPGDPMKEFGKGRFYSTDVDGNPIIREPSEIYKNLYSDYHDWLNTTIHGYLSYFPVVVIVDCHTFNPEPLPWERIFEERPDICIGINDTHIPEGLVDILKNYFENEELSVGINTPYSGAIIPRDFIKRSDVYSIMIEVNKSLYLNNDGYEKRSGRFGDTQYGISQALGLINDWESKKEAEFWNNL